MASYTENKCTESKEVAAEDQLHFATHKADSKIGLYFCPEAMKIIEEITT